MNREVVDLCSSEEERDEKKDRLVMATKKDRRIQRMSKLGRIPKTMPIEVDLSKGEGLLDRRKAKSRKRCGLKPALVRYKHQAFEILEENAIVDLDDDRKPAAKRTSKSTAASRKRSRMSQFQSINPLRSNLNSLKTTPKATSPQRSPSRAGLSIKRKEDVQIVKCIQKTRTPLQRIWEVFPEVEQKYAEKLLRDCRDNLEMVLSMLADGSYPKRKDDEGTTNSSEKGGRVVSYGSKSVTIKRNSNTFQPKYDYTVPSSFEATNEYLTEAVSMLLHHFPFLHKKTMKHFFDTNKQRYFIVYNLFFECLKNNGVFHTGGTEKKSINNNMTEEEKVKRYVRFKSFWVGKRLTEEMKTNMKLNKNSLMKRFVRRPKPILTDQTLVDEVRYTQHHLDEWMELMVETEERLRARRRADHFGDGVECGCCFEKVPIQEMVSCRDWGHLFCRDCIQHYANTQVFSNGSLGTIKKSGKKACELLCCDASGCQSGFHEEHLQRALSIKTLQKYTELQFRASIEEAGLSEEICSCPKCGFQADLPLNLVIFECPMEDCQHKSCRKCGKDPHIPLGCDEVVKQNREDEGRLKVEEALAEAKIRKCPKCSTPFVKSDGCNKMTCRCGAKMCYQCRKLLNKTNPYAHFCQIPHCRHTNCKGCTLYSNAEEDDLAAMREAGLTAAQSYQDELKRSNKDDQKVFDINIDVDKIMNKGRPMAPANTIRQAAVPDADARQILEAVRNRLFD